jgi:hypothetical protein
LTPVGQIALAGSPTPLIFNDVKERLERGPAAANGKCVMRAEVQGIVDEIKQSVVLLRRHL